jgi:predicted alpha/beta hydrolase family esterase
MMVATLILPGLNGSPAGHWQNQWERDHAGAVVVEQASWSRPALDRWMTELERSIEDAGEVWLVAHSLGCLLAANLARRSAASRVKGALLVAPCDLERTERLHPGTIDFGAMPSRRLPFPSIVVGSHDDPYMSFDRVSHFARLWEAEIVDLGEAGHINIASGFGRWERGYHLLDLLVSRGGRTAEQNRAAEALKAMSAAAY